jgi:arginine-tRNA-protein transferase
MGPGERIVQLIDDLPVTGEEQCPYLPTQLARYRAFAAESVPPALYHELMNRRFRRSGDYFYEPACRSCQSCVPIRVPVHAFVPSRSQRRVARRNQDLMIEVHAPAYSEEKYRLYSRYAEQWHGKQQVDEEDFQRFLVDSPVDSVEFQYRDGNGRLLAVGVCDVCLASVSSVYFYFDPAESQRSLGTYGALVEIGWALEQDIPHYYLGYWVDGSPSMAYKARFRPHELLRDGAWLPVA